MIIASWNVNGLRAAHEKGFASWLGRLRPDVLLVQETKAELDDLPDELAAIDGYVSRLHAAEKKGYSGVGIYARREPDEWIVGLGDPRFDREGRVMGARFGDLVAVTAYFPNSQREGVRLPYRLEFGAAMIEFLGAWRRRRRRVVLGGDFNVAHEPIDLARPKQNVGNPGYLPAEREWMTEFLARGYVDTWRALNPDREGEYSWWSYRFNARKKNVGWRLDYLCVDRKLWPEVAGAAIHQDVEGSDHCPVSVELSRPDL